MKSWSIKKWLAGLASRLPLLMPLRIRHYRGRKVHSPLVYGIVRNAIMKTVPEGEDRALFDELQERGFSPRRAAQLQNLYTFRGYGSAVFANGTAATLDAGALCFAMPSLAEAETLALIERARGTGATLCIARPYENRTRSRLVSSLVAAHGHTSIDARAFVLLFTDERLPKQHFKL